MTVVLEHNKHKCVILHHVWYKMVQHKSFYQHVLVFFSIPYSDIPIQQIIGILCILIQMAKPLQEGAFTKEQYFYFKHPDQSLADQAGFS